MILKTAKRVVVFVIGMTVLLIGVAGIFLPVLQAWLIIPAGLAILATEFLWARRLLRAVKDRALAARDRVRGFPVQTSPEAAADPPPARPEESPPCRDPGGSRH